MADLMLELLDSDSREEKSFEGADPNGTTATIDIVEMYQ